MAQIVKYNLLGYSLLRHSCDYIIRYYTTTFGLIISLYRSPSPYILPYILPWAARPLRLSRNEGQRGARWREAAAWRAVTPCRRRSRPVAVRQQCSGCEEARRSRACHRTARRGVRSYFRQTDARMHEFSKNSVFTVGQKIWLCFS